jgi:hypothetical protein
MKFFCWLEGDDPEFDGFYVKEDMFPDWAAKEAAEFDQYERDGWENRDNNSVWLVRDETGFVRRYEVTREYDPVFYATEVAKED